jgi:hypothetical protein
LIWPRSRCGRQGNNPPIGKLAEASLGVLAVGFAGDHNLIVAWLLAGLAVAESVGWMLLPESISADYPFALGVAVVAGWTVIPVSGVIGALIRFAIRGNVLAASLTGVIGLAVLLFVLWRIDVFGVFTSIRRAARRRVFRDLYRTSLAPLVRGSY